MNLRLRLGPETYARFGKIIPRGKYLHYIIPPGTTKPLTIDVDIPGSKRCRGGRIFLDPLRVPGWV